MQDDSRVQAHVESDSDILDAKTWRIICVVILAPLMTQIDSTVVNVSLTTITSDLHAPLFLAHWILSGYLLALAIVLPLNGWFVDNMGAKKLYLICFTLFTCASVWCGAARSMEMLIVARVFQGVAGGLLTPLTQLMLSRIAGKQMVKVVGIASMPVLIAPMFGPILAGVILKHEGWPWLFYINLPIGILAILMAAYMLPSDQALLEKRPFDFIGFALISPAFVFFLYGLEACVRHTARGVCALLLSLILVLQFMRHARQQGSRALVDIALFRIHTFSVATSTQFLTNGVILAAQFLMPLFLMKGCELNATQTGWILSAMGMGMLCMYPLAHRFTEKFGIRAVSCGGVTLNMLGTLPFLIMALSTFSLPVAVVALFVRGFGQGATGLPSIAAAYASIPKEKLSSATTAVNIVQRLGGPVMTTLMAIAVGFFEHENLHGIDLRAFVGPLLVLILFQFLVFLSAMRLPVRL